MVSVAWSCTIVETVLVALPEFSTITDATVPEKRRKAQEELPIHSQLLVELTMTETKNNIYIVHELYMKTISVLFRE